MLSEGSVLNKLPLGLSPEDAEKYWPGPKDSGSSLNHSNSNVEPANVKVRFESAVGELMRLMRNGQSLDEDKLNFVASTLSDNGAMINGGGGGGGAGETRRLSEANDTDTTVSSEIKTSSSTGIANLGKMAIVNSVKI